MIDILRKRAADHPDAIFVRTKDGSITVENILLSVANLASTILSKGLIRGSKLAAYLPDSLDTVELFLACQSIGVIFIPIAYTLPPSELKKILGTVNPDGIFCRFQDREWFLKGGYRVLLLEERHTVAESQLRMITRRSPDQDDVCIILFTSGTSGATKAVELTAGNFLASYSGWDSLLRFTVSDQYLCCLPLNHVGGLSVLTRAVLGGFPVTLLEKFNPETVIKYLTSGDITLVSLVPDMLRRLITGMDRNPFHANLRAIILGGAPMPPTLETRCLELSLPIVKSYGMTETCSGVSGYFLNKAPIKRGSSGKPFQGVNLLIDNGRIVIRGQQVMKRYSGAPETNGIFRTQDRGYLDEDGYLFMEGRMDDVIISGGENISLAEVEAVMNRHRWISESAAAGIPDERWGQKLVVFYVPNAKCREDSPGDFTESDVPVELSRHCRKNLAAYKIPKEFIPVESIPKTPMGKIDRGKMADKLP